LGDATENYHGQNGSPALDRDEPSSIPEGSPPGDGEPMDKAPHGQESAANAYPDIWCSTL
jgi:hypothetical protein